MRGFVSTALGPARMGLRRGEGKSSCSENALLAELCDTADSLPALERRREASAFLRDARGLGA